MIEFSKYIKETRLKKKLSLRELEQLSGISNAYISQIETGTRGIPTLKIIKKLAKVLKISEIKLTKMALKEIE